MNSQKGLWLKALMALCLSFLLLGIHPNEFVLNDAIAREIEKLVRDHYIDRYVDFGPCRERILKKGLDGFDRCLDKYTVHIPKSVTEKLNAFKSGALGGVGFSSKHCKPGEYRLIYHVSGSAPAQIAGLLPGDMITHIGGKPITVSPLKRETTIGLPGEPITVDILREGEAMHFKLTRDIISPLPAYSQIYGNIGYVWLVTFNSEKVINYLAKTINRLLLEEVEGIIIDLRYNGGGSVSVASSIISWFLKDDASYDIEFRGQKEETKIPVDGRYADVNIVLLVNRHTKSAAERTAGILQQQGLKVVGSQTFGKGTRVQNFDFRNESQITISIAEYLIGGKRVEGVGITPDIVIANPMNEFGDPGCQPHDSELHERQLQVAIEVLKEEIANSKNK